MAEFFEQQRRDRVTAALLIQPVHIHVDPLLAIRRLNRIGARRRSHHLGALKTNRQSQTDGLQTLNTAELSQKSINGFKAGRWCCPHQGRTWRRIERRTRTGKGLQQQGLGLGIGRQGSQLIQHGLLRQKPKLLGWPRNPLQLSTEGERGRLLGSSDGQSPRFKGVDLGARDLVSVRGRPFFVPPGCQGEGG